MIDEAARQAYLSQREQLKPREFWDAIDAWPLYVGTKNLHRYIFIGSLLDRVRDVPGDVAEFGCWRGATTSFMAKWLSTNAFSKYKTIHAFDTFEGFDAQVQAEKDLRSGYKGNLGELQAMLALNSLEHMVRFHVGDICQTVRELEGGMLSFIYIDCDVYEPTEAALRWTRTMLAPGGLVVFDEYGDPDWPGETRAADEFLRQHGDDFTREATPVEQPSLVLMRK